MWLAITIDFDSIRVSTWRPFLHHVVFFFFSGIELHLSTEDSLVLLHSTITSIATITASPSKKAPTAHLHVHSDILPSVILTANRTTVLFLTTMYRATKLIKFSPCGRAPGNHILQPSRQTSTTAAASSFSSSAEPYQSPHTYVRSPLAPVAELDVKSETAERQTQAQIQVQQQRHVPDEGEDKTKRVERTAPLQGPLYRDHYYPGAQGPLYWRAQRAQECRERGEPSEG